LDGGEFASLYFKALKEKEGETVLAEVVGRLVDVYS